MQRLLNAVIFEENGWHIAQCVEIDVASQGNTKEEAFCNLQEAITLHLQAPRSSDLGAFAESLEAAQERLLNSTVQEWRQNE